MNSIFQSILGENGHHLDLLDVDAHLAIELRDIELCDYCYSKPGFDIIC